MLLKLKKAEIKVEVKNEDEVKAENGVEFERFLTRIKSFSLRITLMLIQISEKQNNIFRL